MGCSSCSSCGSSSGCTCLAGSGSSYSNCDTVQGAKVPYYAQGENVLENHCQQIICERFSPVFCSATEWVIPNCNETASFLITDAISIPLNSYIWIPEYGYFLVVAFDSVQGQLTVENTCIAGNAAAGTAVPTCSCFLVTPPPCESDSPVTPFLAQDFVAPEDENCVVITVTTTAGLAAGLTVSIATGSYLIDEILSDTTLRICNEGSGVAPGTTVVALDANGNYQHALTVLTGVQQLVATGSVSSVVLDSGNTSTTITTSGGTITNPFPDRSMTVMLDVVVVITGNADNAFTGAGLTVQVANTLEIDGGGAFSIGSIRDSIYPPNDDHWALYIPFNFSGIYTINPLATVPFEAETTITWIGNGVSEYEIASASVAIAGIGAV